MFKQQTLRLSLLVTFLLLLPSCKDVDQEKKKSVSVPVVLKGEVLFTIDGKPKITVDSFEKYRDQFFEIQPQYKQVLQFMPPAEKIRIDQNIFQNMMNEILFQEWVEKNQIDKRKGYQDDLKMIIDMGKRNLAIKFYQEQNPIKVTETEIKKFYEDNKDKMQEFMESPGGVNAKGVKFENEADAKNFLKEVKNAGGNLEKVAKDAGHKIEELKQINQMSFHIDSPVRQKLLELKNFPTHLYVKAGEVHHVLQADSKDNPTYVPFDKVKPGLENYLKQQKMGDMLTKGAEELRKKYKGVENTKYFTQKMVEAEKEEKEKQEKREKNTKKKEKKSEDMPLYKKHLSSVKGA